MSHILYLSRTRHSQEPVKLTDDEIELLAQEYGDVLEDTRPEPSVIALDTSLLGRATRWVRARWVL